MDTNGPATTLFSFDGADGASPQAALVQGADGGFYGTAVYGGIGWNGTAGSGNGAVFRLPFPTPPVIATQPLDQPAGAGGVAIFTINATGNAPLNYFWLKNGAVLPGATNATLTLTNVATGNLGNYEVVITNSLGSVTSAIVTLTITNPACVEPPPGIVAWWTGDNTPADLLGGHDAVLMNGAGFTNAFVGSGFAFNGGAGYVELPQNLFPSASPSSIELWFETTAGGVILEQESLPVGWVPELYVGIDGNLYVQLFFNGAIDQISTSIPVNDGVFHHLAVTYDGNNEAVFLDGTERAAKPLPYSSYASSFSCQLGSGYTGYWPAGNGGEFSFDGVIDEVSLYTNALTAAQVLSIYNAGAAGKCMDHLPPGIIAQPVSLAVLAGRTAAFTVAAYSLVSLSYQWFEGPTALAGATNATLSFTNVAAEDPGNYNVVITNSFGSVTSAVVALSITNPVCVEPPPGIVAWWPGQGNADDIVGGHNGALMNGAGFTNAYVGDGFAFNGGAGCVALPPNLFPGAGPFSIELWFETAAGGVILGQQDAPPFGGPNNWVPELYVGTDGCLHAQLFWNGAFDQIGAGTPVNDGTFHHVAVTYDETNETVYLDGAELGSRPLPYSSYTSNFFSQLGLGYTAYWPAGNGGWFAFDGSIDEVSLYSNALTAPQVLSIYNAGAAGKCIDELLPVIITQPAGQTVVAGGTAVFAVTATNVAPLSYQWLEGVTALAGATNTTYAITNAPLSDSGAQFSCLVSNFLGSSNSSAASLTVLPGPLAISHVTRLPNGGIQITMASLPGLELRVMDSTNLINWHTIATLTNFTGTLQFTDPDTTNSNCRFYQLTAP
jgi:hypothetical protein